MIVGYTVRIDPAAIGYTETVIVQVTLESHNDETLDAFGKALEEIPKVLEAFLISGGLRLSLSHRGAGYVRLRTVAPRAALSHSRYSALQIELRVTPTQAESYATCTRASIIGREKTETMRYRARMLCLEGASPRCIHDVRSLKIPPTRFLCYRIGLPKWALAAMRPRSIFTVASTISPSTKENPLIRIAKR